jgi:uncharacterized protein
MKILIAVNHPAQFHLFKNVYHILIQKQHNVVFVIKDKDILSKLMISEGVNYHKLTNKRVGKNKFYILLLGFIDLIIQDISLFFYASKFMPDIMLGTDYSITHVGKFIKKPSFVFNEDDFNINKLFCKLAYPFATLIISPKVCDVNKYERKKISYQGYQKLAYLHPKRFNVDDSILELYNLKNKNYFIIRLVSYSAGHDIEMKHGGIDEQNLEKLIDILGKKGQVYISSENTLSAKFQQFTLKIDPKHMHHILSKASLFIADSQSMIVEAAMLGTPSIRFNSFVGKISVLEELENKYNLTCGVHNSEPEMLIKKVKEIISNETNYLEMKQNREKLLNEKIDVTSFFVWFIENYPKSEAIVRKNPDYQYNFK